MTDRLKGFVVVFDKEIREDDAEALASAIRRMRGVREVRPVMTGMDDYMNRSRIALEVQEGLLQVLSNLRDGKTWNGGKK